MGLGQIGSVLMPGASKQYCMYCDVYSCIAIVYRDLQNNKTSGLFLLKL